MSVLRRTVATLPWRSLIWLLPFVLAAGLIAWWPGLPRREVASRQIALDASQFAFSPGRLEIHQGDRVTITLTASDVVHGFYLDGYGLETRVVPGISQQIVFTADQPGKFRFRCAVSCGPLHPFMIGELIVTPNNPFWKAAGLVVLTLAAMLTYLRRFGAERTLA
jgi:heme/copper-type cytochrome/quinol oxidase subunit 2